LKDQSRLTWVIIVFYHAGCKIFSDSMSATADQCKQL